VVASGDAGRSRAAVGQSDFDLALVGERFVGGDDEAGPSDKAGGPQAAGVHRDDGGRCARDNVRNGGRQ
jgi:hypothetical protein